VIHVARLHLTQGGGKPADKARGAIHGETVDEFHVADAPEPIAETACAAREYELIEFT
jgi:hypothetical protein